MRYPRTRLFFSILLLLFFIACKNKKVKPLKEREIVLDPKTISAHVKDNIKNSMMLALDSNGKVDDSLKLNFYKITESYYRKNDYKPLWSDTGKWFPQIDSLLSYLDSASLDGLFKEHYQYRKILAIKTELDNDSIKRRDAILWTKADILLTDAFMHIAGDLRQGRLQPDSLSWKNDTSKYSKHFFAVMDKFRNKDTLSGIFLEIQPKSDGYVNLKACISSFLDSMDSRVYTYIDYPYKPKDEKDSLKFIKKLLLRLSESDVIKYDPQNSPDSIELSIILKKYQKLKKLTVDGKVGNEVINSLNATDIVKYDRIAVTLDRYKQLPDSMPVKYIWVNLPGYYLQVHDSDSVVLTSKIICGKPKTPTPFLTSAISDLVVFPTWTVPESIIKKDILPALKKNPGYLARKGLNLYDREGEKVDPFTVKWSKYKTGIPYKIQQGSGDDNALGVIKFNFSNPYAVYLHDTNERWLFNKSIRDLSHGCVRVQEWEKLAFYILRNDSAFIAPDTLKFNTDSITSWIANKEKHTIGIKSRFPLFIRYFTCEAKAGRIKFYDDMYGDDKSLKEKYFTQK
ncbi:MAG: L,D-transpeptidase family protein [Ferruginibacter sp.]